MIATEPVERKCGACGAWHWTLNTHAKKCPLCVKRGTKARQFATRRNTGAPIAIEAPIKAPGIPSKALENPAGYTKTCARCKEPYEATSKGSRGTWCPSCAEEAREHGRKRGNPSQSAQALDVRRRIACAGCEYARREERSETGWDCMASKARDCQPYTAATCYVPKNRGGRP